MYDTFPPCLSALIPGDTSNLQHSCDAEFRIQAMVGNLKIKHQTLVSVNTIEKFSEDELWIESN